MAQDHSAHSHHDSSSWKGLMASAVVCGLATLGAILLAPSFPQLATVLYLVAYAAGGWDAAYDSFHKLRHGRLDIHFLMLAVAIGAACIQAWWEGAALLFLFSFSEALEALANHRTEREIRSLFRETPRATLLVLPDGSTRETSVDDLRTGDTIRILPGSMIPADARVLSGESAADESSLTGESVPIAKQPGDTLFSGTLNDWGKLDATVLRPPSESAHARIIRLIRDAQASKAPSQRFTDRFGTGYTLLLLGASALLFAVWHWVFGLPAFTDTPEQRSAFYRAMTFLVVGSPCALVISIPSAILSGIAAGARHGILFRGGIALENLATIQRLAVDKTGTLTTGELKLIAIESSDPSATDRILQLGAALSNQSTHPLSRAIVSACLRRNLPIPSTDSFESLAGQGLRGTIEGQPVVQGRRSLFPEDHPLQRFPDPEPGTTEVLVASPTLHGRFILRDAPRPEAAGLIERLQNQGIAVTMLTGDRPESAAQVAQALKLKDFRAGLHPQDKVDAILEWRKNGEIVAMAGDGINDAPSLAAADVSIGMGLRGSDAVLEQADVVLTQDRLERIVEALDLSRRCRVIIRQNLAISLGIVILLAVAALGAWIPLPLGVMGHEGSTLLVVLNSLRLLLRSSPAVVAESGSSAGDFGADSPVGENL